MTKLRELLLFKFLKFTLIFKQMFVLYLIYNTFKSCPYFFNVKVPPCIKFLNQRTLLYHLPWLYNFPWLVSISFDRRIKPALLVSTSTLPTN